MAESAAPSLNGSSPSGDPLSKVLALGEHQVRTGAIVGFIVALLLHGAGAVQAAANLFDVESFAEAVAGYVRSNLQLQIEIDNTPPPPPPPTPEPPPPEPEPEKAPPPPPASPNEPPPPPPAPAEAAKILTSEPDPDAPVDLTDQGIVSGEGALHGGITSSAGTAKNVVRDLNAKPGGVPGGTGTAPAPVKAPEADLSRRPAAVGSSWDCGFPSEADLDGVDLAFVELVVMVGADGRAKKVTILKDPGSGFGNQARQCAMRRAYAPGLDKAGQPVASSTSTIRIRFTR
jgi:protein TonB